MIINPTYLVSLHLCRSGIPSCYTFTCFILDCNVLVEFSNREPYSIYESRNFNLRRHGSYNVASSLGKGLPVCVGHPNQLDNESIATCQYNNVCVKFILHLFWGEPSPHPPTDETPTRRRATWMVLLAIKHCSTQSNLPCFSVNCNLFLLVCAVLWIHKRNCGRTSQSLMCLGTAWYQLRIMQRTW